METPITITFRRLDRSFGLAARAREFAQRLAEINDRITSCHVTIEGHVGHPAAPGRFQAKFDLAVPGAHIHAESAHGGERVEGDAYGALRVAFSDARRQLVELAHRRSSTTRLPSEPRTREPSNPA